MLTLVMARTAMRMGAPADMAIAFAMTPPEKQSVALLCIPLFHATAGEGWLQKILHFQQKLVLLRRWNVADAVKACVDYGCGVIGGVPAVTVAIIQHPDLPKDHKFESTLNGGAASPARLAGDLRKRWPEMSVAVGWGMTETNALTTAIVGDDYVQRPKAAGWPMPFVDLKIVDPETRKELPRNEVGLILSRGPNNMTCYYNNEKATRETLVDGYVDTGDAGYIDDEGILYIADRIKDIIIRGGENIASEEVENAVYTDDRIAEAAAVPVPDDMLGELVAVAVTLRKGCTATPQQIQAHVHDKVRPHARPAFVWISDELLPRNVNGKLVKTDIKKIVGELYAKHLERAKM
jgi:acyl-CoA synthetase (AMP-forming)/AMP-acid ligase II